MLQLATRWHVPCYLYAAMNAMRKNGPGIATDLDAGDGPQADGRNTVTATIQVVMLGLLALAVVTTSAYFITR